MKTPESFPADLREFVNNGGTIIGVDTDTQFDFVDPAGALYVPAPKGVSENLQTLSKSLQQKIGSVDSHAFDSWEFNTNKGDFPPHCVKGEPGWTRVPETRTGKTRFVPISKGHLQIGESIQGEGNRDYDEEKFAQEVVRQGVTGIFEKEVYSAFSNPNAEKFIQAVVDEVGGVKKAVFAVYGYCTGGFCVDAFAEGLRERGYQTAIVEDAVAPIGGEEGAAITRKNAKEKQIALITTQKVLEAIK